MPSGGLTGAGENQWRGVQIRPFLPIGWRQKAGRSAAKLSRPGGAGHRSIRPGVPRPLVVLPLRLCSPPPWPSEWPVRAAGLGFDVGGLPGCGAVPACFCSLVSSARGLPRGTGTSRLRVAGWHARPPTSAAQAPGGRRGAHGLAEEDVRAPGRLRMPGSRRDPVVVPWSRRAPAAQVQWWSERAQLSWSAWGGCRGRD